MVQKNYQRPILTVSIAAYNAEKYLHAALDSCLCEAETGRLEVIIVNDGSTDNTGMVADDYAAAYPGLFRVIHKQNGNYGSALNASLSIAKGIYYRLLDSDDWFDAEGLSHYLEILSNCTADVCCTSSKRIMAKSGVERFIDPAIKAEDGDYGIDNAPIDRIPGPGISNLTFRSSFLRKIGFKMLEGRSYVDEELRIVPWLKAASLRIDHIPVYCVLKEREGQSTSIAGIRKAARDKSAVLEHLLKEIDFFEIGDRKAERQAIDEICNLVIGCYMNILLLKPNFSIYKELKAFDAALKKENKALYKMAGERFRTLKLLRLTRFWLYAPLAKYRISRWQYA